LGLLKKIGSAAVNAAFGTKEERQEKQRFNQQLAQEAKQARLEGKRAGTIKAARKAGYQEGLRQGSRGTGIIAGIQGTVDGLNRVEKAFGFDKMFTVKPTRPARATNIAKRSRKIKRKHNRFEDDDPFGVFS
jgi:hypothetical protein